MDLVGLESTAMRPTNTAEDDMPKTIRLFVPDRPGGRRKDASIAMHRTSRRIGETTLASA
jgi:hypothetical protein